MTITALPSFMLIAGTLTYFIILGGTINGILIPSVRLYSVLVLGILAVLWFFRRRKKGFPSTSLDLALPIWIIAFALSLLENSDQWRRIAMGLWFVGVYCVSWYILNDLIANRLMSRKRLINALLFVGVIVIYVAYLQFFNELRGGVVSRPVSSFGNPNTLASFLVMLLPFAVLSAVEGNKLMRVIMTLYTVTLIVMIGLTFSRAAWIGTGAMILVAALWLYRRYRFQIDTWIVHNKVFFAAGILATIAATTVVIGIILSTMFSVSGRSLYFRTYIFNTAFELFSQQPIWGHGLFTFGGGLAALNSTPPSDPHSHAHNLFLNVGAELGIVGLIALVATINLVFRATRRNFEVASRENLRDQQSIILAAGLSMIGYGVNHLLDMPSMVPAVFMTTIMVMAVAAAPIHIEAAPSNRGSYRWLMPIIILLVVVFLGGTGIFSGLNYSDYMDILGDAVGGNLTAQEAATAMQSVIDRDPAMAVYHQQQGILLAAAGNFEAAANAFGRAIVLAPEYAVNYVNQAASFGELGRWNDALSMMQRAQALAPEAYQYLLPLSIFAESAGQHALARQYSRQLLNYNPDFTLLAAWSESPIRSALKSEFVLTPTGQVAYLISQGNLDEAASLLEQSTAPVRLANELRAFINLERGDPSPSIRLLDTWQRLYVARAAQLAGDVTTSNQRLSQLNNSSPFAEDSAQLANVNYVQFLRLTIPRQWIPQARVAPPDPVYAFVLEWIQQQSVHP